MPAAGRLGDRAQVPIDSHGCPSCPHPAVGPAVSGSGNVNINGRPALRVSDKGMHAACCGSNTWEAVKGAPGVFINGQPAHRLGDVNQHCGGVGRLVEGSTNVFIGDLNGGHQQTAPPAQLPYDQAFRLVDEDTGKPIAGRRYRIVREDGMKFEGRTDRAGETALIKSEAPVKLQINVFDED